MSIYFGEVLEVFLAARVEESCEVISAPKTGFSTGFDSLALK